MIQRLGMGAMLIASVLAFTGCSGHRTSNGADVNQVASQSQAYLDGYNGNIGVAPATVNNAGSPQEYCQAVVALHPDYTKSEQSDYINGCLDVIGGSDSSTNTSQDAASGDLLTRLNSAGGDDWTEDAFGLQDSPAGFETDYLASGACTLWVFDTGEDATAAAKSGFLDNFSSYGYAWGTDSSGAGVIAMYEDNSSACASDMLTTLGWGTWP